MFYEGILLICVFIRLIVIKFVIFLDFLIFIQLITFSL